MNKQHTQEFTGNVALGPLIERLGPLNNRWREGTPSKKVLTLWDMGDVILASVAHPSDALLWEVQARSYITRNLLRYALITRRTWGHRKDLEEMVSGLRSFTVFREALPFLKENREGIDEQTYHKVALFLRDPNTQKAIRYLKELKARKIGRRHRKGVSVAAIRDEAVNFERAFARLETEIADDSTGRLSVPADTLIALSQTAMAVATGEVSKDLLSVAMTAKTYLPTLAEPLTAAVQGGRASMAAFRKIIGAECLMQAADLLNSMRTEEALAEWRSRHGAKILLGSRTDFSGSDL
jgi:hypothetical protein